MSWHDVVAAVTASFEVVIRRDDWLGLLHRDPDPAVPPQKVKVARLTALGQEYVSIVGDVFDREAIDPSVALAINHALPIGAIELEDDRVLLRATTPLGNLDAVYLRRIILHVARQSAHMRKAGSVRDLGGALFTHYAE